MSTLRRRAEAAPESDAAPDAPGAPADLAPLSDRVGFWLRLAQQTAFDAFHRAMSPLGLTPGRLAVLLLLEAEPDMRQTALAEALRVKPPNLAVLLAALEQDGLIRRTENAANRRVNLLRLTPAGRALLRRARVQEALVEEEICAGMDAAERAALVTALRRIARA
jgi:DNA-binding MarR family transcriptional regulator